MSVYPELKHMKLSEWLSERDGKLLTVMTAIGKTNVSICLYDKEDNQIYVVDTISKISEHVGEE